MLTEEQIEKLWCWCGLVQNPQDGYCPFPYVTLDNLERWAFPKLAEKKIGWILAHQGETVYFLAELECPFPNQRKGESAAEALALAILACIEHNDG